MIRADISAARLYDSPQRFNGNPTSAMPEAKGEEAWGRLREEKLRRE